MIRYDKNKFPLPRLEGENFPNKQIGTDGDSHPHPATKIRRLRRGQEEGHPP